MAFSLVPKSESFFYPVTIPVVSEQGVTVQHKFDFKFRRVSRTKIEELRQFQAELRDTDTDNLERDADYVMEIAEGWRHVADASGKDAEFSRENVKILLDNYPHASGEIVSAFFEALAGGAKRKN